MIDKIKILPGRVVVRPSEPPAEQKTGSGIIIPGTVAK
jgi:co-chaperonin GroES (HSP10)